MKFNKSYKYYLRQFLNLLILYVLLKTLLSFTFGRQIKIDSIVVDGIIFSFIMTVLYISYLIEKITNIEFKELENDRIGCKAYIILDDRNVEKTKQLIKNYVAIENTEIVFEECRMAIIRKRLFNRITDEYKMVELEKISKVEISMNLSNYGNGKDLRKLVDLSRIKKLTFNKSNA